ncbi:ROK family protein [Paenibacillus filicis]|uniref:ROK family protein n=1 Tax=Paenibacillus gyeongsangnamensis TaxID=3388067 RepID=A0ABT4Q8Q1_9BACL|nr:ROK family protein [Paenibacillus filicis]MCZ8513252.1 ROK family protein [Paenibacillus filicis]
MARIGVKHDPDAEYAVAVDVGGTKTNAGIVSRSGEIVHTVSLPTQAGGVPVADRISEAVEAVLMEFAKVHGGIGLKGIGIGTAGQVDWAEGSIRYSSDLIPGYGGTPLKRLLQERFGLPVWVDNDVNVLALTEKTLGAGRGVRQMLCLALGTGVGGAVMIDGQLLHGAWGGAAELGHLSVDFNGLPCVCGSVGCLEQYASGTGIAKRMRAKLDTLGRPEPLMDTWTVIARWQTGDGLAAEVMDETFAALGAAAASLIHTFNPEVIVVGGGVADAGEPFLERIRLETAKRSIPSLYAGVRIVPAYRGNWSGMIGAGLQAWEYDPKQD